MTFTHDNPRTMRAIDIQHSGGPEVLVPALHPIPQPATGQILIRVEAAGVNRPDIVQRRGLYPPPPGVSEIPGLEVAGRVAALGDGELKRLYLLATAQGGGIGARLFEQALDWLERDGPRTLWISVWSENYGAQRFYARYGFEHVGEYEFIVGQQHDREFMFRRKA